MTSSFLRLAVIYGLSSAIAASPTLARADSEAADDLIKRGVELRKAHKDQEALALFQQAHQTAPSPRSFGQMAFAEQALRRLPEAYEHILAALAAADDPWVLKNQAALTESKQALEQEVGSVVVSVVGAEGATVRMGGHPPAEPGTVYYAEKGKQAFTIEAPGRASFRVLADVKPGTRNELKAEFPRSDPGPTSATSPVVSADEGSTLRTLGFIGLGAGAVGFALMGVGIGVRSGAAATFSGPECFEDEFLCPDQASSIRTGDAVMISGAIIGGLLLSGGITMLILAPPSSDVSASVMASPSGLVLSGRF